MNENIPISEFRANIKKYTDALCAGEVERILLSKNNEEFFELRHIEKPKKDRELGALEGQSNFSFDEYSKAKKDILKDFSDYV